MHFKMSSFVIGLSRSSLSGTSVLGGGSGSSGFLVTEFSSLKKLKKDSSSRFCGGDGLLFLLRLMSDQYSFQFSQL